MRLGLIVGFVCVAHAQPYIVTTVAGSDLPPTPVQARNAALGPVVAMTADAAGNVFVATNNCVFRIDVTGVLTRVAGKSRQPGYSGDGRPATDAQLNQGEGFTAGLLTDSAGNLYISDFGNNVVRKVSANGIISTVAGNGVQGYSGDGFSATAAQLSGPRGLAGDSAGNLYIADSGNHRIRKLTPSGIISTVAGNGNPGSSADGGLATAATLLFPFGVAVDTTNSLYIADQSWRVRKVGTDGIMNTVAGNGSPGWNGDGGPATSATLSASGIALDHDGNLYIAVWTGVRRVTAGIISTVAGNGGNGYLTDDVPATSVPACAAALTVDSGGNLYIADPCSSRVRKVTIDGIIHSMTADGLAPYSGDGGPATSAQFANPSGLAIDNVGNLLIADTHNHRVRKLQADGTVVTIAGTGVYGFAGDGGPPTSASLALPLTVTVDSTGNIYIGMWSMVRKISTNGTISTIAGTGSFGYSGDGGQAVNARVGDPKGLALDKAGNLYIAETGNNVVRKISVSGIITTMAGTGVAGFSGDGGPASSAQLSSPCALAFDTNGNLFIADCSNWRVRKVTPNGTISTVAGNGISGFGGDGGPAINAPVCPSGVTVAADGSLLVTDQCVNRIRKVTPDGMISSVAGTGVSGNAGDGGLALAAQFASPLSPVIDRSGDLYVLNLNLIRMLVPAAGNPVLSVSKTHISNFQAGQFGATYSIDVSNNPLAGPTSGTVTVRDLLPAGMTLQSLFGAGWNCASTSCTRSDVLNPGASYPPITVTVDIPADAPLQYTNQVTVNGGHATTASTADVTTIPTLSNPVLLSPANGSVSIGLTATLNWSPVTGATSYDIYFGTSSNPPLVSSSAVAGYSPVGLLPNNTYYWRVVAWNGARSAGSATFYFTTVLTQVRISGNIRAGGIPVALSGSQNGSTTTDATGNYSFSGLPAGGTYTVTPSLTGYTFTPPSQTFANVTANQTADFVAVGFQCIVNAAVPPTVRGEGLTEPLADIALNCTGGTPTPAGTVAPKANITVTFNTQLTNRLSGGGNDIVLAIDEPLPTQVRLCVPGTANPGAPTASDYCPVMGTGGSPTEFKSGNANIIRGTMSGNSVTFTGVPFDPPGASNWHIYRIMNWRGDATRITGSIDTPGLIIANIQVNGLVILGATQIVAFVQPGLISTLRGADGAVPLTAPVTFQQCATAPPQRFAAIDFAEYFPTSFRTRTVAGTGITAQNTLGLVYNSESGYYNPNLPVPAALADFGTRLKAVFNNIPPGVSLYTSTGLVKFTNGVPQPGPTGNVLTVEQAALTTTETGTLVPVAATQTLDGIPAAQLPIVNGTATAIWEVTGANPLHIGAYIFPLWISFNGASPGTATVNQSFAPSPPSFSFSAGGVAQDASYPVPRFADTSTTVSLFQITSCAQTVPITFTTVPAGQWLQLDGATLTSPQTVNWVPGSSHTIGVPASIPGGGVRYVFVSWSDGGASSHNILVPSAAASYTLTYQPQYLLTLTPSPTAGGSVTANPPSPTGDGYYDNGASVQVTATATSPYQFTGFSGALTGIANPQSVTMTAPATVTANFFAKAVMASPAPGSLLADTAVTFTWSSINGASAYWLDVGTVLGQGNIFGNNVGLVPGKTVTGIPMNGGTIYVRLWTQINGVWQSNDYTYTTAAGTKAVMSSPAQGAFISATTTFTWTAGVNATAYWLDVGSAQGSGDYFAANLGLATSKVVSPIPANGRTVYVRLWTQISGNWLYNDYTYTIPPGPPMATMSTPAPGSVLAGSTVTFTWFFGVGSAYWLDVGTAKGKGNILAANVGLATTQTVSGIPTDGSTIYVRLWTLQAGVWSYFDYTYTAATLASKAVLTSPPPGGTFAGSSVSFAWSPGGGASAYWLDVGTTHGHGDIYAANLALATSQTVSGIPTTGGTIYVRLWTQQAGVWSFSDYTYTAATLGTKAVMTGPAPGSTLSATRVTFSWSAGSGASAYWLDVGTVQGQGTIFQGNVGLATSQAVTGIPTSGGTIYVRLWTQLAGGWSYNDYTYTAASVGTKAVMLSPAPGSTLAGSSVTFNWSAAAGASAYWLDVGTAQGQGTIFGNNVGLVTSQTVTGIPVNGGTIYVRLWTQESGVWSYNDYTYTAASVGTKAVMLSPAPGSTLAGPAVTFTWSAGSGASAYWLDVGTIQGQGNIFGNNVELATNQTVTGIPTNGGPIYVRLWTQIAGVWQVNDYTYTGYH